MSRFVAALQHVSNRGRPPESFLESLVLWGKVADEVIFAPNANSDIYSAVKNDLGPWRDNKHRRAVMLEVMRVHAGFESSWHWEEGVDTTNRRSMANPSGQEAGIFQVSFDSEWLGHEAMKPFAMLHGLDNATDFITAMKTSRVLALEYYGRLIRVNVQWAGPIARGEINQWLRRDAVAEFEALLAA